MKFITGVLMGAISSNLLWVAVKYNCYISSAEPWQGLISILSVVTAGITVILSIIEIIDNWNE